MLLGLLAAGAAASAFGVAAVLQGIATATVPARAVLDPRLLVGLLRSPAFVGSLLLNLLGFLLHVAALQFSPLFLVQAVISSSVAVTAVLAARVLRERLRPREQAALGAVVVGLALLAGSAADGVADAAAGALVPVLAAALALGAAVGALAGRSRARWVPAVLGLLAGGAFAVVALCARVLPDLRPATVVGAPASWLLVVSGAVALLLYAAAMQRGSVTRTTAAMVVTQTAVPAAVGVAVLGDEVRPGFAPLALLGFTVALGGVLALARFEAPPVRSVG